MALGKEEHQTSFRSHILLKLAEGILLLGVLAMMGGVGAIGYQAIIWLKSGHWDVVTLLATIARFLPSKFLHWLIAPSDWIGANEVIRFILSSPLGAVLIVAGFVIALLGGALLGAVSMKPKKAKRRESRNYHGSKGAHFIET